MTENRQKNYWPERFKGCFAPPELAKRAWVSFLFGLVGMVITGYIFEIQNKIIVFFVALLFSAIGYWSVSSKIIKNNK